MNPYASRPDQAPRMSVPETESKMDQLQRRLRQLGATGEESLALLEHWYQDTDDWGDEDRARIMRSSDTALRAMIVQVRKEWADATG